MLGKLNFIVTLATSLNRVSKVYEEKKDHQVKMEIQDLLEDLEIREKGYFMINYSHATLSAKLSTELTCMFTAGFNGYTFNSIQRCP